MAHHDPIRLSRRAFMATSAVAGLAATRAHGFVTPRLRAGLIGRGTGGQQLLAAMGAMDGTLEPVAVGGRDGGETPWERLVERDDLDAILIATPDHRHAEMAAAALCAGKHVYIMPPFTRTGEEARQLEALAREGDRVLQVGMDPAEEARWAGAKTALVQTGAPLWIQAAAKRDAPLDDLHWQRCRECSHGPAARRIFNMLYPLQYHLALGAPKRATALAGVFQGAPVATPDGALMTLRYGGTTVVLSCAKSPEAGSMRGMLGLVELPAVFAASGLTADLGHFVHAIAGDRQGARERLRAACIAQESVCTAMDLWAHWDSAPQGQPGTASRA